MLNSFSIVSTRRTYSIDLFERNYPSFQGRYDAYIAVYGQLSGDFVGWFGTPLKMDVTKNDMPELLRMAERFVKDHAYSKVSIW